MDLGPLHFPQLSLPFLLSEAPSYCKPLCCLLTEFGRGGLPEQGVGGSQQGRQLSLATLLKKTTLPLDNTTSNGQQLLSEGWGLPAPPSPITGS